MNILAFKILSEYIYKRSIEEGEDITLEEIEKDLKEGAEEIGLDFTIPMQIYADLAVEEALREHYEKQAGADL